MLALTFPGQGSQRSGMGRPWVDHPSWEVVAEASDYADRDLAHLLLDAPMEELTPTANAQLSTFVLSLVVLDAVERVGLAPGACAGHSLGEYTALVAAGALSFADGTRLVLERGEAMAVAAEREAGTMAALLGIADADAAEACRRAGDGVWVANYNARGQVVLSGTPAGVEAAGVEAKSLGARKVMPLPVSGAFHTPLMAPASERLAAAIGTVTFQPPEVPVVANVDAEVHADGASWPSILTRQLCAPVLWHRTLERLGELGATVVAELGPGGVLTGLMKRTLPDVRAVSVATPGDLDTLMDAVAGPEVWNHRSPAHQGEHLYTSERVIVSPGAGVFDPDVALAPLEASALAEATGSPSPGGSASGSVLSVGDRVGGVGAVDVRTPFEGVLVRWLAVRGERVAEGQPVAWIRTAERVR
ncbi:MAG: ACP S-malonyltransferase [Actinomycetota bacterium]|nr:ACP S-malonyltransferase [Actinomycetota bacterium]